MDAVREQVQLQHPADVSQGPRDRGIAIFAAFTAATLLMVAAITAVGLVGSWWVLAPVMLVDLAVTFGVMGGIARLLSDDGD